MNRLSTILVLYATVVFLLAVPPLDSCQAQTYNFIDIHSGDPLFGSLEVNALPADELSDFGLFTASPSTQALLNLGTMSFSFSNFVGNVVLSEGELRSIDGEAVLFTGSGLSPTFGDISLTFFDKPGFLGETVRFEVLTFSTEGNFVLAVPEPSSAILIVLCALPLGIVRNRKHHI